MMSLVLFTLTAEASTIDFEEFFELATVALLGIGLVGLAGVGVRRRWKKQAADNRTPYQA